MVNAQPLSLANFAAEYMAITTPDTYLNSASPALKRQAANLTD